MFICRGPLRLSRPQFPNVPATGLENAAALYQAFWLGLGRTGFTPARQLSRSPLGEKTTPAESHELVSFTEPLWIVVMVVSCQPPMNRFATPPWSKKRCPLPKGRV